MSLQKRLDLKVGFRCNNNCIFCAQAHKRHLGDQTTDALKKHLREGKEDGCTEVVFTGGEPTIREDILELVKYAKDLGYEAIQIQSNGRMFSYRNFCEKIIKAGATEFSPALHGPTAEIHEIQTRAPGSFAQTVQGIKNLVELDQYVMTNSVVTKYNYKSLPELAELLIKLGVDQFQLAFVHPVGNAWKNFDKVVPRKSDVKPYIHRALDIGKNSGVRMMVEAFPFCFMRGYEKYCSELFMPRGEVRDAELVIKDFDRWRKESGKAKFEGCKKCKFDLICEGPWKEYPQKYGWDEFKPVLGNKVTRI
ncbi:MAG: hypothetical protein DRO96_02945 [Candidatus Aenigmatarchaeota archaeon]|nr:MAG: hypothetical protein DRO96_02945 [Candidatus Aenigmarchaeota archaeon]